MLKKAFYQGNFNNRNFFLNYLSYIKSVSYTHLDVYKRQPYRVAKQISKVTYTLEYFDEKKGTRGNFDVRQLKQYIT